MGIIRVNHNRERPYVCISRAVAQNAELTFEARGLLVYFLSQFDGWQVHSSALTSQSPNGKVDRITRILDELMRMGYLRRSKVNNEAGQWEWISEIFEEPLPPEERQINAMNRVRQIKPRKPKTLPRPDPEKPGVVPGGESPDPVNPGLVKPGAYRVQSSTSTDLISLCDPDEEKGDAAAPPAEEPLENKPSTPPASAKPKKPKSPAYPEYQATFDWLVVTANISAQGITPSLASGIGKQVKELLDTHSSLLLIQQRFAAGRAVSKRGVSLYSIAEIVGSGTPQQPKESPPSSAAPPALTPAQQKNADRARRSLERVRECLPAYMAASPITVDELRALYRSPVSTACHGAYNDPRTHAEFLALLGYSSEQAVKLLDEPRFVRFPNTVF